MVLSCSHFPPSLCLCGFLRECGFAFSRNRYSISRHRCPQYKSSARPRIFMTRLFVTPSLPRPVTNSCNQQSAVSYMFFFFFGSSFCVSSIYIIQSPLRRRQARLTDLSKCTHCKGCSESSEHIYHIYL